MAVGQFSPERLLKRHVRYLYIWLGLLIATFSFIYLGQSFQSRGLIFAETSKAVAKVMEYQPENHAMVYYEYAAKGSSYKGAGSAVGYAVGDEIEIRYSNEKPWLSEISENLFTPRELLIFCLFASFYMSSGATLMLFLSALLSRKFAKLPSK